MVDAWLREDGGYWLREDGGKWLMTRPATVGWHATDASGDFNISQYLTVTSANLVVTGTTGVGSTEGVRASSPAPSGKFQYEVALTTLPGGGADNVCVGIDGASVSLTALGLPIDSYTYVSGGGVFERGAFAQAATTAVAGQIVTVAGDTVNGTLKLFLNGVQQGTTTTGISLASWWAYAGTAQADVFTANFTGPFTYQQAGYSAYDPGAGGTLTGSSSVTFAASGTLTGTGALTGTSPLTFASSSTIQGLAPITGASSITFSPSSTLTGKGALSGASSLTFTPSGTATGTGALVGASTLAFSPIGTITGSGALTGTSTLAFTPTATLTGKGALSGASTLTFAPSGAITGRGALSGTSSITFAPLGTLANGGATIGALSGSSSIGFSPAGTLSGSGALVGSTGISFAPAGTIGGIAYITGITSLTFTVGATLHGEGPFKFWRQPPLTGRRTSPGRSR